MGTIERKHLERLEKLLEAAEKSGDREAVSALRWAIMNLEHLYR